ncbi:hypothetical protein PT974_12506 [Cladobotryum mycophilum]|uniref:Uncharacterized protein n=1 Tax=Cladobotryum mycophilum TaxID=491253 RepID=A0ABR0S9A3_9HYPO
MPRSVANTKDQQDHEHSHAQQHANCANDNHRDRHKLQICLCYKNNHDNEYHVSPTETFSYTLTTCAGTSPAPSFHMQVSNLVPTSTDKFNSLFATQTPIALGGTELATFDLVPNVADSALYNINCVGRLVTRFPSSDDTPGDLFPAITYFQSGFEGILMLNQSGVIVRGWFFVMAEDRGADGIYLYADQTDVGRLDILQTVPAYQDGSLDEILPYVALANYIPDPPPYTTPFKFLKVAAT